MAVEGLGGGSLPLALTLSHSYSASPLSGSSWVVARAGGPGAARLMSEPREAEREYSPRGTLVHRPWPWLTWSE